MGIVYLWLNSSLDWIPPRGSKSVDVFLVGGGNPGTEGYIFGSGQGGNGGECKTYLQIPIDSQPFIRIEIGQEGKDSKFMNDTYIAHGGQGPEGGKALTTVNKEGNPGQDGMCAFNDPALFDGRKFGASGGGGGASDSVAASDFRDHFGGDGGKTGAGKGGFGPAGIEVGGTGEDGSFCGAGGGGGGKSSGVGVSNSIPGFGYHGCAIIRYMIEGTHKFTPMSWRQSLSYIPSICSPFFFFLFIFFEVSEI